MPGVARGARVPHDGRVLSNSYSYALGPVLAFAGLGILILLLRWAFSRGHSVVAAPPKRGKAQDYGLLIPIAQPGTYVEGEIVRRRLEDAGIRATLAQTLEGPRIMVWPADADAARECLSRRPGSA